MRTVTTTKKEVINKTVTQYIAHDGRKFDNKKDCEKYEDSLRWLASAYFQKMGKKSRMFYERNANMIEKISEFLLTNDYIYDGDGTPITLMDVLDKLKEYFSMATKEANGDVE